MFKRIGTTNEYVFSFKIEPKITEEDIRKMFEDVFKPLGMGKKRNHKAITKCCEKCGNSFTVNKNLVTRAKRCPACRPQRDLEMQRKRLNQKERHHGLDKTRRAARNRKRWELLTDRAVKQALRAQDKIPAHLVTDDLLKAKREVLRANRLLIKIKKEMKR